MSEKENSNRRTSSGEKRNVRNTFEYVKEFASSSDTVGRNEELEQSKNIPENVFESFSSVTDQFRLSEIGDVTSSKLYQGPSFNFNSNFSDRKNNSKSGTFTVAEKSYVSPIPKTSKKVRHLPFRTISQETIANISKKIGKFKEVLNTGHGSTSTITGSMSSKKSLSENTPSAIVLPKEHLQVLQNRIKTEIENLKYLESSDGDKQKPKKKVDKESDEDFDLEELGSDIQFLPAEQRERVQKKLIKVKHNQKTSKSMDNKEEPIITIDLTKELSPCKAAEKTELEAENDYPSLDLDYGSKINWDDGDKATGIKHSIICEKPIVNLDLDESKLTVETTRKIEDIKNKLGRSLSIGLTHKEAEKEVSTAVAGDSVVIKQIGHDGRETAEGSSEDAETLELASLRCTSERTEVIADRERRRKRCADYPGLAFGFSIFSSDTMMKFSIIRNELHNIVKTQLKRVCIN